MKQPNYLFCTLLLLTGLSFTVFNTSIRGYDRYLLDCFIPVVIFISLTLSVAKVKPKLIPSIVLLVSMATFTTAAQLNYMNMNRARWQAIGWLEDQGIDSSKVDGGAEYSFYRDINLWHQFEIGDGKHKLPEEAKGTLPSKEYRWWPLHGDDYIVSLKEIDGYERLKTFPVKNYILPAYGDVLVLKRCSDNRTREGDIQ